MKKSELFENLFKISLILLVVYLLEIIFLAWQANIKIFILLVSFVCINIYCKNYFLVVEDKDYSHVEKMILFYSITYFLVLLLVTSFFRGQRIVISNIHQANLIPIINTIKDIKLAISDKNLWIIGTIFCNIVMFVPFSYLLPRLKKNMDFKKTVILILGLSLIIECFQYMFGTGVFDIDDIILNGVGAIITYPLLNKSHFSKMLDKFILFKTLKFAIKDYLEIGIIILLGLFFLIILISSYWKLI